MKFRLAAHITGLQAEERLAFGAPTSVQDYARLVLESTGDPKRADDALSRAEEDRLSRVRRE